METRAGVYGKRKKRGRGLQGDGNWSKFNIRKTYKTLRNILQDVEANEKGNKNICYVLFASNV